MDTDLRDPLQEAAAEAGGFEGLRLHHNCKEGVVYLDGVAIENDLRVAFLMETATHGELEFDLNQKRIYADIKRYVDEKPNRGKWAEGRKPNTACLGVREDTGQILTYAGASWKVRSAFETQLLKPYARARKFGTFPIVSLGLKPGQKDDFGNFMPDFAIVGWTPRSRFAQILGEGDTLAIEAPMAAAPAPIEAPPKLMTVTSGRGDAPPPIESVDDGYAGPDSLDGVEF